ncbi:MAG: hypothetical protein AAFY34_08265 [Pseudomonadota bacterium]
MSDIFEEVEEGYRQDRLADAWKRFGPFVWLAAFLLIGAVAWFEWSKAQAAQRQSAQIQILERARTSLEEGDYVAAQTGFRELAAGDTELSVLARHLLADTLYKGSGDAAAASEELQTSAMTEAPLEKLARLKSAYLTSDGLSLEALETTLGGLHEEDGPLGILALELVAAKAFATGDLKRAREEFSYLRLAAGAPQGVVQRAELALSVIPVVREDSDPEADAVPDVPFEESNPPASGEETEQ